MDLILILGGFYLWQCLVYVPPNTTAFIPILWRRAPVRGGGIRLLNPVPSRTTLFGVRPSIGVVGNELTLLTPARHGGLGHQISLTSMVAADEIASAQVLDSSIRVGRKKLTQAVSPGQARKLHQDARSVASLGEPERKAFLETSLAASLSLDHATQKVTELRRTIRPLSILCDLYAALIALAAPVIVAFPIIEETLLLSLFPAWMVLHTLTLIILYRAHKTMFSGQREERSELMIISALFPPSLLRTPQMLSQSSITDVHPSTLAVLLLPQSAARSYLRKEQTLARYHSYLVDRWGAPAWEGQLEGTPAPTNADLNKLAQSLGTETHRAGDFGPREPSVRASCPICGAGYVTSVSLCLDCRAPTLSTPSAVEQTEPHTPLVG